jgi:tetratricopeptide (TPR) repeat protein
MLKAYEESPARIDLDQAATAGVNAGPPSLWAREACKYADRGDLIGALRRFEKALEMDIDCHEAWLGLSDVFLGMRDIERSEACLEVARLIRRRAAPSETA